MITLEDAQLLGNIVKEMESSELKARRLIAAISADDPGASIKLRDICDSLAENSRQLRTAIEKYSK